MNNLRSPDLLAIEEVQDNTGPTTTADRRHAHVADADRRDRGSGRADVRFRQIDPHFSQDGGEPGGNIRVGFLFRTDRGLSFVDRPGGDGDDGDAREHPRSRQGSADASARDASTRLNPAFVSSRKPLAGEFTWRGETLFAVVNHFSSKGGDHPLFGRFQPPLGRARSRGTSRPPWSTRS